MRSPTPLTVSHRLGAPLAPSQFRIGFIVFITIIVLAGASPASAADRPNVLVIYTDDQGIGDVGVYGATDIHTPNIDALARSGVRFTQFYSAAPVCSPSRAALMTGRYPQRAGLASNAASQPGEDGALPAGQVTMAEVFRDAGYDTAHIGKWHLGYTPPTMPNAQGFDLSFGHMGGCIDNYSHFFYWGGPNRHDLWRNGVEEWRDGEFFGDLMVAECERFLESRRNAGKPFFLYWAINMPHYPLQAVERWRKHYASAPEQRARYAAFVSTMDEMIGSVLTKLEDLSLRDKTIVVFQSDHGHSTEERTFNGGGSAGPYRGAKFSLFEGGIRVPAAISWPGRLTDTQVRGQLAANVDWLPTLVELCGIPGPDAPIDGVSLVPILRSGDAPDAHATFHWLTGRDQWAVRRGPWKLIGNPVDTSHKAKLTDADRLFLVNLDEDITEMTNHAGEHPETVAELTELHEAWTRTLP